MSPEVKGHLRLPLAPADIYATRSGLLAALQGADGEIEAVQLGEGAGFNFRPSLELWLLSRTGHSHFLIKLTLLLKATA